MGSTAGTFFTKDFDFSLLESEDFKEDSVREELIKPLLNMLGYKASGAAKIYRSKTLKHPFVKTGTGVREITSVPDYLLSVDEKYAFVLDAKAPKEEIKTGLNREQAFFYAIHPDVNVQLYALCNGKEFALFSISTVEPLLYFHVSELDKHWKEIESYLSPGQLSGGATKVTLLPASPALDYTALKPLSEVKGVRKQAAKRHFGVHGYFTKQPWDIVQAYVKHFSNVGDVVLDPFGGTGVTLIESLLLGRKAIHVDLNPLSVFMVRALVAPVSVNALFEAYDKVQQLFNKRCPTTEAEVRAALKRFPYPKDTTLPQSSDVKTVEQLFTPKQLAQLAYLKFLISKIVDTDVRDSLLLAFSSTVTKINLTYHPSSTRGDNAGDSAAFRYYRYRIAPKPVELSVWNCFETKVKKLVAAKKDIGGLITKQTVKNGAICKGTATDLNFLDAESVDYIYTDPPYGAKIPYLDLSIMWNEWLGLRVTKKDYELEAIEGGEYGKSQEDYNNLIAASLKEMYRVLKFDRWMSFVFQHKDPAYWHTIVENAQKVGFEYVGSVSQKTGQSTFKKRQNPFTVLHGQLIINFRKTKNPKTIMKADLGDDVAGVVMQSVEGIIAMNHGASLEEIYDELIVRGMELGFLHELSSHYNDLTPFLSEHFDFDQETKQYHIRKNTKFKTQIPLDVRIKYYLLSYLRQMRHHKVDPTFDEIVLNTMPLLKNGITPEAQTILNVLEEVAFRIEGGRWRLQEAGQHEMFEQEPEQ